jgi:hypothetical protein
MENYPRLQTLKEEKRDPIRTLWRNVLLTAVIDLLKKKKYNLSLNLKKDHMKNCGFMKKTLT